MSWIAALGSSLIWHGSYNLMLFLTPITSGMFLHVNYMIPATVKTTIHGWISFAWHWQSLWTMTMVFGVPLYMVSSMMTIMHRCHLHGIVCSILLFILLWSINKVPVLHRNKFSFLSWKQISSARSKNAQDTPYIR